MGRRSRVFAIAAVLALSLPGLFLAPATSSAADRCPDLRRIPGIGLTCPAEGGLLEVFDDEGASLGFTHGIDPHPAHAAPLMAAAASPPSVTCVEAAGEHVVHAIYTVPVDVADAYATVAPTVRRLVQDASAMIDAAAIATRDRLSLRVLCAGGEIVVDHVRLSTPRAQTDFASIVSQLRAIGYDDPKRKYWVYHDDQTMCGCFGVGNFYPDDSASADNLNNAGPGAEPMFAVVFDVAEVGAFLHELGHTLGAVQNSAPFSTLKGHCYDGRDVMCYNDGGDRGALYRTTYCSTTVFDCGKNTYCHAYPPAGSYLATNWQACSRSSRFLVYPPNEPPVIARLDCTPSPSYPEETVTCTVRADDAAPEVRYELDWGDGTVIALPATGAVASGTTLSATHVYAAEAEVVVRARATDNGHPPLTSAWTERAHSVLAQNLPPQVHIDCGAAAREGEPVTCALTSTDPHPVAYRLAWGDGSPSVRLPASGYAAPDAPQTATRTFPRGGTYLVTVTADDAGRPPKSASIEHALVVEEVNTAPALAPIACATTRPKPGLALSCTFTATDDSTGVAYEIDWGDGRTERAPASGFATPGAPVTVSHVYASEMTVTLSAHAVDDFDPPLASAPRTQRLVVQLDQEPPTILLDAPRPGNVYRGCTVVSTEQTGVVRPAIFLGRGCMKATVLDPAGIARVEVLRGGGVIASRTSPPWTMEFDIPTLETDARFTVRAYDRKGNPSAVSFGAHAMGGSGS